MSEDQRKVADIPEAELHKVADCFSMDMQAMREIACEISKEADGVETPDILKWAHEQTKNQAYCVLKLHTIAMCLINLAASVGAKTELRRRIKNN